MKRNFHLLILILLIDSLNHAAAQVTLVNNNNSLSGLPIFGNSIFLTSDVDSTLWISDGTQSGTKQFAFNVKDDPNGGGGVLNSKIYFAGLDATHGSELWVTDGTAAGTLLVQDLEPGIGNSTPDDFFLYKGDLYFTANTTLLGRELYKISGSNGAVSLFKDINPGTGSAFSSSTGITFFSNNNLLYFTATDGVHGNELWVSDGTSGNTKMLDDITAGPGDTKFGEFTHLGNEVIFSVITAGTSSLDLWKTDGTTTSLVKSFNVPNSGLFVRGFLTFNNLIYFSGTDVTTGTELWSTDGTTTVMVKDLDPGNVAGVPNSSAPLLLEAVFIKNHFIFTAKTATEGTELWTSDGTAGGTVLLKDINPGPGSSSPRLLPVINYSGLINGAATLDFDNLFDRTTLFNGSIFLIADDGTNGQQLWKTDGTPGGTSMVKNIGGTNGGVSGSYFYTNSGLYFDANDVTHGDEPWFTDGTSANTNMVYDVNPGALGSSPNFEFIFNNQLFFSADNGDSPVDGFTDLYKIDAVNSVLPVTLLNFTATLQSQDVKLDWSTSTEINSSKFIIQRSIDGTHFTDIGSVDAAGNSSVKKQYSYYDNEYINAGANILYYRLQLVDIDGRFKYSGVLSVKLNGPVTNLEVYPNPVHDQLSVLFSSANENKIALRINDVNGHQMYYQTFISGNASNLQNINVSRFATGIYFVQMITDKEIKTVKFIKQ